LGNGIDVAGIVDPATDEANAEAFDFGFGFDFGVLFDIPDQGHEAPYYVCGLPFDEKMSSDYLLCCCCCTFVVFVLVFVLVFLSVRV